MSRGRRQDNTGSCAVTRCSRPGSPVLIFTGAPRSACSSRATPASCERRARRSRGAATCSPRSCLPGTMPLPRIGRPSALWQLDGFGHDVIELTVPLGFPPKRRGVIVHRSVSVDPADRTEIDAIPVTRIEATIIAVVSVLPAQVIPDVVDSALVQGLTRADRVLAKLLQLGRRGRRNAGELAAVLEARLGGVRPHANRFERRLSRMLVRAGLVEPVAQFEVRERRRVDRPPRPRVPGPQDRDRGRQLPVARWPLDVGARSRPTHEARGRGLAGPPLLVARSRRATELGRGERHPDSPRPRFVAPVALGATKSTNVGGEVGGGG